MLRSKRASGAICKDARRKNLFMDTVCAPLYNHMDSEVLKVEKFGLLFYVKKMVYRPTGN